MKVFNPLLLLLCSGLSCAFAADIPGLSNSIVRFHFSTGDGPVGDVDVELFDTEKPGTVQNFLLYVRGGSYNKVLLNRLLPGVLLEGGGFTNVANPTNANPFLDFGAVTSRGTISNEFNVGAPFSNIAGTLAMAKNGTNADSATSSWFFNLGDNSTTLDTESGGYTVFGRVLDATNAIDGTNLLATFNALSQSNGIIDMTSFFGATWAPFTNLPVNYSGYSVPQSRQLFYVTVTELEGPEPDTNAPTLNVSFPAQNQLVTNATITLTGTATDDVDVARVLYFVGNTTPQVASGTTNWSATVTLNLGTNVVSVQSVDAFGNVSPLVARTIRYELPSAPITNTIVRFHIFTGEASVGDVDVELFNADKPQTVRNFLLYARNGSYDQVILNRLLPGVLLQGGGFTNAASPTNINPFLDFGTVKNLGTITNEFSVGTRYSNVVGTIAMAKSGTNANSASSQWFFNLGDNSGDFDSQSGGFTVFGRVLPGTNSNGGTNLLATFNSLSPSNGIIDMTSFFGDVWASFTDLPVNYIGYAAPQSRQIFYVKVTELNGPLDDTNAPTVFVSSPSQNQVVTNATLTLTGTAADNRGVARVLYFFGDSTPRIAIGTNSWTATVTLSLGTNVISFQSVDAFGNLSTLVSRTVLYELPTPTITNSLVRFHFATGERTIGHVDVELFDADKPQTVRNFLLYVRNGSYNGIIAHRLAPRFVLQSGGYTVADPASSAPFTLYNEVNNLGMITNEFGVGTRRSNFFGTIAMAKLGNNANSASSEWFFNLANNSTNLDSQNGGFTVFGRVVTNQAPNTNVLFGTNLLASFNNFSKSNGIVDMSSFYDATWSAFNELPVDYTNTAIIPQYRQLIYLTVTEMSGLEPDLIPPTVAITNPAPDSIVTNATVTLSGTASDDRSVARVIYFFGDTAPRVATGTTNWSAVLSPRAGTNFVFVQSVDRYGNLSPLVEHRLVQLTVSTLSLTNKGNGQITGFTNGQQLEVGQVYTITAAPGKGSFFSGWSGTLSSAEEELTFRMTTNMSLTATFKPFPLPKGQGAYAGLFIATNQPSQDSAGVFTTRIKSNRRHSGKILYRGGNYVFDGALDREGQMNLQGTLLGQNASFTLRLDITESPQRLAGVAFIGGTVSALEAYRVEKRSRTNAVAPVGDYTFLLSGAANAATAPGGQGYGRMQMAKTGKLVFSGTLGEGTTFTQKSQLVGQDRWPVYVQLYEETGALIGWSRFNTNESGAFSGPLFWFKPADLAAAYYPTGFTTSGQLRGAPFTIAPAGQHVLNWTNGTVIIQGGDLARPLTFRVTLDETDTFTVLTGPTSLALSIDRTTGNVSGSFFHPVTQAETPLVGIIVQGEDGEAGGLFYGPIQTGSFSIQKQ